MHLEDYLLPANMEIEFKLSCTPEAARALSRHLNRLTGSPAQRLKLQNTYYDTPQQDLRSRGIALRIRKQNELQLQTVKCAGRVSGGLSSRPEWETPYGGQFDFSPITDAAVRQQLETLARLPGYRATLDTNFTRHRWLWQPDARTKIEVVLDRGLILAGGRQERICELELELVSGPPERLFDLVALLANQVPLFPAPLSKATRGSLLLSGNAQASLAQEIPAVENQAVFIQLTQACLDHISINLPANCEQFSSRNLHQVRVGMRRLRALLQLFQPLLRRHWYQKAIMHGARSHMRALAAARGLQVLVTEIIAPTEPTNDIQEWRRLHTRISSMADQAFDEARAHLLSQTFAYWLLHTSLALHAQPLKHKQRELLWSNTRQKLLAQQLHGYAKHLRKHKQDAESLHELRKAGKHLRYQLAATGLADNQGAKAVAKSLSRLQKHLGQLNDLYSAGAILNHQPPSYTLAITRLAAVHQDKYQKLHEGLPAQIRHLRREMAAMRAQIKEKC